MEWTGYLLRMDSRLWNRNTVTVKTLLRVTHGIYDGFREPADRYEVLTATGWAVLGDLRHSVGWYGASTGLWAEENGGNLEEWQKRTNTILVREDSLFPVHGAVTGNAAICTVSGKELIKQVRR